MYRSPAHLASESRGLDAASFLSFLNLPPQNPAQVSTDIFDQQAANKSTKEANLYEPSLLQPGLLWRYSGYDSQCCYYAWSLILSVDTDDRAASRYEAHEQDAKELQQWLSHGKAIRTISILLMLSPRLVTDGTMCLNQTRLKYSKSILRRSLVTQAL